MLNRLESGVIVVTGTNGKTTSTKLLTAIFKQDGKKVLTNPTGSNFTRGVVSSIVQHSNWAGKLNFDLAVIELDEAYAAKFVKQHKPRISLVLNVMRDQMDRFGEIDHTSRLLSEVVANTTEAVILNRDDPRVFNLNELANCEVYYFGVSKDLRNVFRSDDELHGELVSNSAKVVCELQKIGDEKITTQIYNNKHEIGLSLYGIYNAQNVCAVITAALASGIEIPIIKKAIVKVKPAFGRGERIDVVGKKVILQLVKNPGGFRHSLMGATNIEEDIDLIAINDNYADGRDVSWLWDVDFSTLMNKNIITAGSRAEDMALRLKYDDINVNDIEQNLEQALDKSIESTRPGGVLHVYTTYTAMLKLRSLLSKMTKVDKV